MDLKFEPVARCEMLVVTSLSPFIYIQLIGIFRYESRLGKVGADYINLILERPFCKNVFISFYEYAGDFGYFLNSGEVARPPWSSLNPSLGTCACRVRVGDARVLQQFSKLGMEKKEHSVFPESTQT